MKLIDIMWFYGDIIFYLTFFGLIYLFIILKKDEDEDHKSREADHLDSYEKKGAQGALPANQKEVSVSSTVDMRDPVCGMELDEKSNAPLSRYLGHTFHFCSKQCKKLFVIYPHKYIGTLYEKAYADKHTNHMFRRLS
jgi:YHS domain-containing protein